MIRNFLHQYTIIQINTHLLSRYLFINALNHQQFKHAGSLTSNLYNCTLFNLINANDLALFLFHEILSRMILTTKRLTSRKNLFLINHVHAFNTFNCFSDSTAVPTTQEGTPIPPNVDPTAYNLIMLEVDDILPSPLTPLVLPPPVPEPVCEMQTPALFTMAQSSPQPQSVDTAIYARVNPLPSPATSSSSSCELRLYIDSDGNSPSLNPGPTGSSQELLLQGNQPPVQISSIAPSNTVTVPHSSQSHLPSWADEVEQSGDSTPDTVVPNWAASGRILGPQPRSQPLVYPPPVFLTPRYLHQGTGPSFPLSCHNRRLYNHRTIDPPPRTIIHARTHHRGDDLVPQSVRPTLPALLKYKLANHRQDTARVPHEAHSPHPPGEESTPFRRHKAFLTALSGLISVSRVHYYPWN